MLDDFQRKRNSGSWINSDEGDIGFRVEQPETDNSQDHNGDAERLRDDSAS
jgi:hypothetical protein